MNGLMMDYQLTLPVILRRAETLYPTKQIISRLPDRSFHWSTYAELARRARQLAVALQELGVQPGDRVATFCWNHHQHLEAYFGIPACGGVLHTLNLRLHPDDLTYIVNHAADRVILVDQVLLPLFEKFRAHIDPQHIVVIGDDVTIPDGMLGYEGLLAGADTSTFQDLDIDEHAAAAMCYTSGTTGRPKAVLYSHRAIVLHSMASAVIDTLDIREADVVLPVVPMFHANAWGLPFTCTLVGATQVLPGPFLDPASLLEAFQRHRVTVTAGVPTIWLGTLQMLDAEPQAYDLTRLRAMLVGGSAVPKSMIEAYQERHGLQIVQAWGMTEAAPLGSVARLPSALADAPSNTPSVPHRESPHLSSRSVRGEIRVSSPGTARHPVNSKSADRG